jgi:hypothetical protein
MRGGPIAPLPTGEREGPKPQAWEGEGPPSSLLMDPHPPTALRRAPPSPLQGEGQ